MFLQNSQELFYSYAFLNHYLKFQFMKHTVYIFWLVNFQFKRTLHFCIIFLLLLFRVTYLLMSFGTILKLNVPFSRNSNIYLRRNFTHFIKWAIRCGWSKKHPTEKSQWHATLFSFQFIFFKSFKILLLSYKTSQLQPPISPILPLPYPSSFLPDPLVSIFLQKKAGLLGLSA